MPFFLIKGLSFLPFGGLLKNPMVWIVLILGGLLVFGYFKWKGSIEKAIQNQIYSEQVETHLKNQERELERQRQLLEESAEQVRDAQQRRERLIRQVETARARTRNVTPERNGTVAPVLNETLDFIGGRHGFQLPAEGLEVVPGDGNLEMVPEAAPAASEAASKAVKPEPPANAAVKAIDSIKAKLTGNPSIDAWKAKQ